jgi:hypothetical protein
MELNHRKFKKIKPLKHLNIAKVQSEISDIVSALQNAPDRARSFRPHVVELEGNRYIACDARTLNRHTHQSGRGDYRYLFQDYELAAVAVHSEKGGYRLVA